MRPGLRVGKYVLGERIAQGGMAEVWAAQVEGPEGFVKPVALKFILETFSGDTDFERLFVNEARIAAQLQHANLVTIFDFDKMPGLGGEPGRYYIAMERVDGHDLRRVGQAAAEAGRIFPHALSLHVAGEILKGLRYVHDRRDANTGAPLGLIHRDVSPHNVLVGRGGEVKVSDFGIAKAMAQSLGTQSGTIRGKLSYASPEQLRAEAVDHRTDQFALGITLWEMLAGRRLFDGVDEVEIIGKVLRCEIPPLGDMPAGPLHPNVEQVVRRMLSPVRDERFPTTSAALSAVLALPGYTHDGTGLAELFRGLFGDPSAAMSATVRWESATPPPLSASQGARRGEAFTPSPSPSGQPQFPYGIGGSQPHTPRSSPAFSAPPQGTRTVTGPQGTGTPGPLANTPRPGTGRRGRASGYVSGVAFESGSHGRRRLRRPRRSAGPWVLGAMAFLGVGVGAFFLVPGRRIRDRDDLPSTSTRALKPGLNPTTPEATEPTEPTEHVSVDSPPVERPVLVPPARKTPAGQAHPQTSRNPAKGLRSGKGGGHSAQETQPSAAAAVAEPASRTDAPLPARETAPQPQPFQGDPGPNGAPIIQDDKETNGSAKKKARGAILQ